MNKIKYYRELHGWNQIQFSEKLNVSQVTISRWETGEREPSISMLKKLANLFNVTVNDLL